MATTKVLAGNNRLEFGDYHFNSLSELETVMLAEMNKIEPQSETLFRIFCDTACGNFAKSIGYVVHLFRGASTTYATGFCQSVGGLTFILISKASNTWTYYKVH